VYVNDGKGGFQAWSGAPFEKVLTRDQTGVVGTVGGLVVGSANYEDGLTNGGWVRIYDVGRGVSGESVLGQESSAGPVAAGDVEGRGQLDLFVGGRVKAGRYPEPADSLILKSVGGRLEVRQRLDGVGLVSGAVWSDLDGDGLPELILACEWGPVKVFHNEGGHFKDITARLGLDRYTGWWNGVSVGDFDGDGRMDIVAGNWGLNTKYRASEEHPRKLYYGDVDGNGTVDLVEAYYDEAMKQEVPERDLNAVGAALPFVREKYSTYAAYGQAGVKEIYGEKLKAMKEVAANTLASMVFLNRGDHFEGRPLPREAQYAPAFAVCVGDYDGDGREDVFLSQNFFAVSTDQSRCDAGRGQWLRGDGRGGFQAVPGQESGIQVYGEQRGAALCDYDGDGRVDLVVTQNGAQTRLYHNVGARVGLRVRLKGPPGNPQGVGAQLRLHFGARAGPLRELHAGSGYWSQDSAVPVLGTPEQATALEVRWPGGKVTTSPLPPDTREIEVDPAGNIHPPH
jgi:hypothetical protein